MKLVIKKNVPTVRNIASAAIISVALLSGGQVSAASQCKGLSNAACDANAACGWVQSYERKDGRTVNAFCRTKAKSSKSSNQKTKAGSQAKSSQKSG